ncbi:MAG: hypothetical protein IJ667_00590, partial [Synergistaceae bacterium]|nr:hypothetical protein [Synergistaceae bacterium]
MCKKKFSGILLLLLLLIPYFLSASAGTAEATLRLIKIERRNYRVDQDGWPNLSIRRIAANAEREVGFAVTGKTGDSSNPLLLYLQVKLEQQSPSSTGNGSVYVNDEKWPLDEEKRLGIQFLPYMHSFPADYNSTYFPNFFKIKINDKEDAKYRFYVMVRDASTNEIVAGNSFPLTVHEEQESDHPVIKVPSEANPSITSYFSGSTTLSVRAAGERAKWRKFYEWKLGYDNILPKYRDAIVEAVFDNPKFYDTTLRIKTKYIDGLPDGGYIGYLTLYALNTYDYAVSKDIRFGVVINDADKIPTITYPTREVSILPGTSDFIGFGGKYISTWSCDTTALPGFIQNVRLKYNTVYSNTCTVHVTLSPDATIDDTYELKVRASNSVNKQHAAATLKIKTVGAPEDYADPIIDDDETISVVQGGSASAVFTGRYVKRWGYKGDLPDGIDDIKLNYGSNPNRCEVRVTANSEAAVTSSPLSLNIYAYNAAGEEIKTPKTLYINILQNDETAEPIIDETAREISIVPGGTAAVTFTGKHARTWSWAKADGDDTNPDIVENVELNYLSNPARCEVIVKLHDGVKAGLTDVINIYAYNAVGKKIAAPAKLTVKVASTGDNEDPKIDESETVSVIKGGTAKATFTGQHIRAWAYGTLPEAIHAIELKPAANPNRCDVLVTAADKTDATSAQVTIYACNAIGEVTSADLNVTIIDNRDHSDPVIDCNESVRVIAGGTARAVFTGQHINSWKYGNLPDEIKAVELNYAANPNRCEVLVTASSTAAAGEKTVTIYAYNEIGEMTSANLNVTIIDNRDHSDPVIDYHESVSVIAGGTARAVFTGKHINSWKYGNLPDEIKAVELNYAANPNRCDVLVTASSKAAAGAKTVTIYAYNEIGEETSADLSVTIISDSEKGNYDKPVIDGNKSVSVAKGGTARTVFTGKNIRAWAYGNLPDGIKAIELYYAANPNKCEVLVTASSTAQTGS